MTNIPKKLDIDMDFAIEHGILPLVEKVNELIEYHQEEASKGEKNYNKGDYSPEETNKAYIEQAKELDPPESKGECICICHYDKSECGFCSHIQECEHCNPPEHEEEWQKTFLDAGKANGYGDLSAMIATVNHLLVSKEKIKREIVREAKWSYENKENNWSPIRLIQSLGLGD